MIRCEDGIVFQKCGFITIGVGLKLWACIRLIADLIGIGYLGLMLFLGFTLIAENDFFTRLSIAHLMLLVVVVLTIDMGFVVVLIVGLCKRSTSILRVSLNYEIYAIVALILMLPVILYTLYVVNPYMEAIMYYVCLIVVGFIIIFGHEASEQHIALCIVNVETMIFANAASMMRDDQPKVNKWCCSFNIKVCLQTWVYIKIICGFLLIISSTLPVFFECFERHIFSVKSTYPLLGAIIILLIVDISFQTASIVGVHKKIYNILRVFYYYEIFAITVDVILTPVILYTTNTEHVKVDVTKTVIILVVGLIYFMLDVCIIRKVKKEIMKIHHKYELSSLHE